MFPKRFKTKRQKREHKGRLAESWASLFLRLKGYHVLKSRYKTPLGEIDLILKKGNTLIFCEVKARDSLKQGLEALSSHQRKRIIKGAQYFQAHHSRFMTYDCRFDYVIVTGLRCHHLKDAWQT